jgi:diguanylate cyclase (GGDEF)-like protein
MDTKGPPDIEKLDTEVELRNHVAARLMSRRDVIVADAVAAFPFSDGVRRLDSDYCVRVGNQVIQVLAGGILEDHFEARGPGISGLAGIVEERSLTVGEFFTFVHIAMSTSIDELSLDPRISPFTELWPKATQTVRRAAFGFLAAWATRSAGAPDQTAIEDELTTLHTRPVFNAVLAKECNRAERVEHWLSLMLIDIDNLSDINRAHGYGVGDRVLERLGILLKSQFRQHDWVARYAEDCIAVLLSDTGPDDARALSERTRIMIEDRLRFRDYRTDERAVVTVSVSVVSAQAIEGEPVDQALFQAEAASLLERAKAGGRNRVEQAVLLPRLVSVEEAGDLLKMKIEDILKLVADNHLVPVKAGRRVRLERTMVEALAKDRP